MRIDRHRVGEGQRLEVGGRVGKPGRHAAVGAVHVEPQLLLPAQRGDRAQRVDGAGAHRARGADHQERPLAGLAVGGDARLERPEVEREVGPGRDPADRGGAEAEQVGGLLDPGMGLGRGVEAQRRPVAEAALAHLRPRQGAARGQEAHHVRHVAAAHQQPAAVGRVAHQLGDPAHRLGLDLARDRRQLPGADVGVDRGGEQVAERPDRRRRGGDVAEEARVAVQERVIEHQRRGLLEQRPGGGALLGQRPLAQYCPHRLGLLPRRHPALGDRGEERRDPVHQRVARGAELLGAHLERRRGGAQAAQARVLHRAHRAFSSAAAARSSAARTGSSPALSARGSLSSTACPSRGSGTGA